MPGADIGHFAVGSIWISYAIVVGVLLFFSIGFVKLFQHRTDKDAFVTTVAVLAISTVLATICLFPVDIALVSATVDRQAGLRKPWASPERVDNIVFSLKFVYYSIPHEFSCDVVLYGIDALFCLLIIPFTYFWYEEWDGDSTLASRVAGALKYSILFLAITVALLLTGFFIPMSKDLTGHVDLDYLKHLVSENHGEKALSFVLGVLLSLGIVFYVVYTAPGFALFPINLIKQIPTLQISDVDTARQEREHNRESQRRIEVRYHGTGQSMSVQDRRLLEALQREERTLTRRQRLAEESGDRRQWREKLVSALRLFKLALGVFLVLLGILIIVSMSLTLIDKIKNSICGYKCGYILANPQVFNPLNYMFLQASKAYPIDYIFMIILILYFFISTVIGIGYVGIRFLWVSLYKIRHNRTPPQGLLIGTVFLMLAVLALNYSLTMIVAPQYAHYGNQRYCNHTVGDFGEVRDCSRHPDKIFLCTAAKDADEVCTPAVISTFIDRITLAFPLFGEIAFWGQFAFLGVWLVMSICGALKRPKADEGGVESEDEEDERTGLLES